MAAQAPDLKIPFRGTYSGTVFCYLQKQNELNKQIEMSL
jgi:hypothetical protein